MKKCVIFAAQPVGRELLHWCRGADLVIAADAGYRHAMELGVEPDLLLGDYDSAPPPGSVSGKTVRLPAEKDDTDTFYAAREAVKAGCGEVVILGGLGGRLDHTMANLNTLVYLAQHGIRGVLAGERNEVTVLPQGVHMLSRREGWYLSLFPVGWQAQGITLEGLKYPLRDAELTCAWPVGVSNEFAADTARITVGQGMLYCMLCRMEDRPVRYDGMPEGSFSLKE